MRASMPWVTATLKGQKVLARASADGSLVASSGRVEIRYKPTDGRAYHASQANLTVVPGEIFPDEHCVTGEAVPRTKEEKKVASAKKAEASLESLPKDAFVAYADGACSGNPGPAGLGVLLTGPDGKTYESYEYLGSATNNVAELTAILRVLEAVPQGPPLVIHTDSQYSIGVLTKGWKAKANVELVAKIVALVKARRGLKIVYVPGHAGVAGNERADELARTAVSSRGVQKLDVEGASA